MDRTGTVLEGIVLLAAALAIWFWWPTKHWGDVISALLGMTGVCDLLGTAPAGWIHSAIDGVNRWATREFFKWGGAGSTAMGVLALLGIGVLLVAWHPKGKVRAKERWVFVIALLLPFVATLIPGQAGDFSVSAIANIAQTTNYPVSHWLGV